MMLIKKVMRNSGKEADCAENEKGGFGGVWPNQEFSHKKCLSCEVWGEKPETGFFNRFGGVGFEVFGSKP